MWFVLLLLALFAFIDAWYFIRWFMFFFEILITYKHKRRITKDELFAVSRVHGIVLPSDLDMWRHMNNSKYLREMDFGRIKLYAKVIRPSVVKLKCRMALTGVSIRYRRSLLLWQRFTIETRILCWKDDAVYFEQRFVGDKDNFIYAIALIKYVFRGEGVNADIVLETALGESFASPPPPPEVKGWMESITKSSEGLKRERLGKISH